jgi:hypothetical protein
MIGVQAAMPEPATDDGISGLLHRIRSEYLEMPGLRLTPVQAARLWAMDTQHSQQLLDALTMTGFLFRNGQGAYLRVTVG